jgi:hypothetical protein
MPVLRAQRRVRWREAPMEAVESAERRIWQCQGWR